ncbi:MAG TPA: ABC transporter permease [Vicinamibacterales bacterium]|nr:ABC transporter permease [Vicinamibacterales bacterium]
MTALRHFAARLRALFSGGSDDRDFAQELQSHLEMLTEDNLRKGMTAVEARRQAALRIGAASALQSRHRDARGFRVLDDLLQDLRFAGRLMLKEKWFAAAAIAAIALGIGANTLGFTIVNAAYFRGFAFERAEEIHAISWRPTRGRRLPSAVPDFEDWKQARSFTSLGASNFGAINISDDHAPPEQTQGARVTANLFDILRQRPLLGRSFVDGEDRPGAEPVVIIGYEIWTNRYARDPNVVGRILKINGSPATIIGVMPERMKFPENSELWVPFIPVEAQLTREIRLLSVFGRLAPGVTVEQASNEIEGIAQRIIKEHPNQSKNVVGAQVENLVGRFLNGSAPRMFLVVMGAVVFVLLIACANVANLLLSRAMYRSREVAVRYALGATRWRVVRQLLIESIALSFIGGVLGLVLAAFGVRAFDDAIRATGAPYWIRFTIDYRVVSYVAAICVAAGIIFGIAPALQVSRENPQDTLKEGARGSAGNRRSGRLGTIMVVSELALTIVLLCGAGLMLRSFIALYDASPGFEVEGLTRMRMQLPPSKYPTPEARRRFFEQLLPGVEAIPGIQAAAITTAVPPLDHEEWRVIIAGSADMDDQQRPFVSTVAVSPRYFETLGVGVIRGRGFANGDAAPGSAPVVINQLLADRFFRGEDPIGRQLRFVPRLDEPDAPPQPWRTVVGVVPTFLQGSDDDAFRNPVVYLPFMSRPDRTSSLVVRSALPPASIMAAVRGAVQHIDVDQPVFSIETVASVFANERSIYRIFAILFGVLAGIALLLSAVGVYGVIAYAVTQRTQEIGVRMAVGASRWDVSWMFLKKGLTQLAIALAIGIPGAVLLGIVAQFRLVAEIEPTDPLTMIVITMVLTTVALVACVVPAHKASKVDPVTALRAD